MMFRSLACLMVLSSAAAFAPTAFTKTSLSRRSSLSMVSINTSDIKNGLTIELDGEPYRVLNFSIMKQARGAAKTTVKFKNLVKGNTIENTYRSGEKFETAMIEKQTAQFTYKDDNGNYFFMDSQTFDEVAVNAKVMEEKNGWIDEGMEITLVKFKGSVIECVLPTNQEYTIAETEPNVKGNTAQGYTKPATLSSGAVISVPGYLDQGERICVDTNNQAFTGRA